MTENEIWLIVNTIGLMSVFAFTGYGFYTLFWEIRGNKEDKKEA